VIRFEVSDECSSVLIPQKQQQQQQPLDSTNTPRHVDSILTATNLNSAGNTTATTTPSSSIATFSNTPASLSLLQGGDHNFIDIHTTATNTNRHPMPMMQQQQQQQLQQTFQHEQGTFVSSSTTTWNSCNYANLTANSKFCLTGPIRLFELEVGESDFVELRRDQALLVDFQNFAHSFVALLGYCDLGETHKSQESLQLSDLTTSTTTTNHYHRNLGRNNPFSPTTATTTNTTTDGTLLVSSSSITSRYTCRIEDNSSNNSNLQFASTPRHNHHHHHSYHASSTNIKIGARFMVVESNQFRELTHLSLNLQVGTDTSIRQYLSIRLGQLMSENHMLQTFLHRENQRAIMAEDLFQQINTKFHNFTISSDSEIRQTRQQLTEQMEDTIRKQNYQYTALIQEKDTMLRSVKESMEIKLQKVQEQLQLEESYTCDLRNKHKELANINEDLRTTLEKKEVAIKDTNQSMASATLRIQQLENDKLILEKSLQEAQSRIVTLQQSIEGKENSLQQADIYREATDKASALATERLNMHKIQLEEARVQLATLTNEMIQVTDLNVQLQKEKKEYKSKLKLRAKVIKRQEEVLCEKDTLLSNFETKMDKIVMERDKIRKIDLAKGRELEAMKVKLAESAKASEQNKHVSASLSYFSKKKFTFTRNSIYASKKKKTIHFTLFLQVITFLKKELNEIQMRNSASRIPSSIISPYVPPPIAYSLSDSYIDRGGIGTENLPSLASANTMIPRQPKDNSSS